MHALDEHNLGCLPGEKTRKTCVLLAEYRIVDGKVFVYIRERGQ